MQSAALPSAEACPVAALSARRAAVARHPTSVTVPIPSSPLLAEPLDGQATSALPPWCVEALVLTPQQAVELLCACAGRQTLAPGVAVGRKSFAFPLSRMPEGSRPTALR